MCWILAKILFRSFNWQQKLTNSLYLLVHHMCCSLPSIVILNLLIMAGSTSKYWLYKAGIGGSIVGVNSVWWFIEVSGGKLICWRRSVVCSKVLWSQWEVIQSYYSRQLPVFIPEISSAEGRKIWSGVTGEYGPSMSGVGEREEGRPACYSSLPPALLPSLNSLTDSGI